MSPASPDLYWIFYDLEKEIGENAKKLQELIAKAKAQEEANANKGGYTSPGSDVIDIFCFINKITETFCLKKHFEHLGIPILIHETDTQRYIVFCFR